VRERRLGCFLVHSQLGYSLQIFEATNLRLFTDLNNEIKLITICKMLKVSKPAEHNGRGRRISSLRPV
jgi:hypothetical protein